MRQLSVTLIIGVSDVLSTETDEHIANYIVSCVPAETHVTHYQVERIAGYAADHAYCAVCRECTTCNLRPCKDGDPHPATSVNKEETK